jgi:hypothetical protein
MMQDKNSMGFSWKGVFACVAVLLLTVGCGATYHAAEYDAANAEGNQCGNECNSEFRTCENTAVQGSSKTYDDSMRVCRADREECLLRCWEYNGGEYRAAYETKMINSEEEPEVQTRTVEETENE